MYIPFGNEILNEKDISELIENKSDFKVIKDMTRGTKREDMHAFCLSVKVDTLNEIIAEEYDEFNVEEMDEDELFEEYLSLSEEMALDMEEFLPEASLIDAKAYKWDNSDNDIKLIFLIGSDETEERKMRDVMRKLITQCE
ncbi:MAG: hypothetical protein E6344_13530 [Clostridium sp.]|uniref:hypothetical protein n=1 Tax=Clostridium culturomicium TaxID=1499683 RepID=UPI00058F0FF4|nr:hypothetical protein [Clostridium culturomicium]MDU4892548.1 hypothetical protein [Clostridium sp.]MDU7084717.1 hypothetical protein [Clostridium sp.]